MIIYTDGGCLGNPGVGGWAFCVVKEDKIYYTSSGNDKFTTNNKMELTAVTKAIEYAISCKVSDISLFTDSQYVKNGITLWINNWKRNGWKTASKQPVKNKEYWLILDNLVSQININWNWVKGHSGVEFNEVCDALVSSEMNKL